jgi:hypothetical protein
MMPTLCAIPIKREQAGGEGGLRERERHSEKENDGSPYKENSGCDNELVESKR